MALSSTLRSCSAASRRAVLQCPTVISGDASQGVVARTAVCHEGIFGDRGNVLIRRRVYRTVGLWSAATHDPLTGAASIRVRAGISSTETGRYQNCRGSESRILGNFPLWFKICERPALVLPVLLDQLRCERSSRLATEHTRSVGNATISLDFTMDGGRLRPSGQQCPYLDRSVGGLSRLMGSALEPPRKSKKVSTLHRSFFSSRLDCDLLRIAQRTRL